eukprot:scaffold579_cov129-Isochrysis_galbana.AAC.3
MRRLNVGEARGLRIPDEPSGIILHSNRCDGVRRVAGREGGDRECPAARHPWLARRSLDRLKRLSLHKRAPLLAPEPSRHRQHVPDLDTRQLCGRGARHADDDLGAIVAEIESAQRCVDQRNGPHDTNPVRAQVVRLEENLSQARAHSQSGAGLMRRGGRSAVLRPERRQPRSRAPRVSASTASASGGCAAPQPPSHSGRALLRPQRPSAAVKALVQMGMPACVRRWIRLAHASPQCIAMHRLERRGSITRWRRRTSTRYRAEAPSSSGLFTAHSQELLCVHYYLLEM